MVEPAMSVEVGTALPVQTRLLAGSGCRRFCSWAVRTAAAAWPALDCARACQAPDATDSSMAQLRTHTVGRGFNRSTNTLAEHPSRCLEAQGLSWSLVRESSYGIKLGL